MPALKPALATIPFAMLVAWLFLAAVGQCQSPEKTETSGEPLWCTWRPPAGDEKPARTIVLISGDDEYRSEEALPMLGKLLAARFGFTCHCLFPVDPQTGQIKPDFQNAIPGMHLLDDADLVIMALRFRNLPDEQMKHFDAYLSAGKPIVALRTSTHAFRYPPESDSPFARYSWDSADWPGGFGRQVLGETWVSHHGRHGEQSTRGIVNPEHADHPLLHGVSDVWGPTDVYGIRDLPDNTVVLLHGQVLDGMQPESAPAETAQNDPMMPLAWMRQYKHDNDATCEVFCTTMGAATDFQSAGLRRLIVNAALYLTGRENEIDEQRDVTPVAAFDPTDFGFGAHREGLRPADWQ